jgi:co-chaperonin GroES (HSP10)
MLGKQVLVTATEKEETTSGGIILTAEITKGSKPALVLAVSDEIDGIKAGDRVYLEWSKSMPIDHEGGAAAIISAEYIKAVIS